MVKCCVCGRPIHGASFRCEDGYVCDNDDCFVIYRWNLLAKWFNNSNHELACDGDTLYQIGSTHDDPRGFGGLNWRVNFSDGTSITTNSLWYIGPVPEDYTDKITRNADIICLGG